MSHNYGSLPAGAGGSASGSTSTHASIEAISSTSAIAGSASSAAINAASPAHTPDHRRHGLGLINGEPYSSSPSSHQYQSSRLSHSSQQSNQYQQQQSYHQYQQQHQHQHHHHHAANNSISSSSGFRPESNDSGLTPSFSASNVLHSSPNLMSDAESLAQPNAATTNASSQILIASIVQRLVNKLPCNSGWRLQMVEEDELVRSCVVNLINLSCFQLGIVVKELLGAIEMLVKQSSQQRLEQQASIGILHSQLFILKVLVSCLNHQWRVTSGHSDSPRPGLDPLPRSATSREDGLEGSGGTTATHAIGWSDPPAMDDTQAKHVLSVMTLLIKQTVAREDASFSSIHEGVEVRSSSRTEQSAGHGLSGRAVPSERSLRDLSLRDAASSFSSSKNLGTSSRSNRDDVDARDESGASGVGDKYPEVFMPSSLCLASSTSLFVLYPCFPPTRSPFDLPPTIDRDDLATAVATSAADGTVEEGKNVPADFTEITNSAKFNSSSWSTTAFSQDVEGFDVPSHLQSRIYRLASQVVFYLSSSNWVVVSARLRNRLYYLSSTIEEAPSTAELRLLECPTFNVPGLQACCRKSALRSRNSSEVLSIPSLSCCVALSGLGSNIIQPSLPTLLPPTDDSKEARMSSLTRSTHWQIRPSVRSHSGPCSPRF